jgi:hypothetical protein
MFNKRIGIEHKLRVIWEQVRSCKLKHKMCMNCKLMLTSKLGATKVEFVCVRWVDVNEILASVLLTSVQTKNVQTRA